MLDGCPQKILNKINSNPNNTIVRPSGATSEVCFPLARPESRTNVENFLANPLSVALAAVNRIIQTGGVMFSELLCVQCLRTQHVGACEAAITRQRSCVRSSVRACV